MAEESDRGIHPEVMRHIVDLHRKHAELQMQLHDKDSGEDADQLVQLTRCVDELTTAMKEQTAVVKELLAVMKEDVKADRAVAESERSGRRKQPGERGGAPEGSGKA